MMVQILWPTAPPSSHVFWETSMEQATPPRAPDDRYEPQMDFMAKADAWLSLAIGIIVLLMSPRLWDYARSRWFGSPFTWTFGDPNGAPLPYPQTVFYPGDVAIYAFALALIADGIVLAVARRKRRVVMAALALMLAATAFNIWYVIFMMQQGYGLQMFSGVAAAVGIYVGIYQAGLVKALRRQEGVPAASIAAGPGPGNLG